jgi:hypothetical protein
MRPIDLLLSCLCGSAFAVGLVFARASWPEGRRPVSITPAFARAVHFRFALPRETYRAEHDSAFVANFPSEASVVREKLVALLDGKQHGYSLSPCGLLLSERAGGSDPQKLLGGFTAKKWGRSRPICPVLRGKFRGFGFRKSFRTSSLRRASGEGVANLKVQSVIPTFFTGFVWSPAIHAGTGENFCEGWSDPRITLGTEPCAKVGSLQPNTGPCRVQIERPAMLNFFLFRTLAPSLW